MIYRMKCGCKISRNDVVHTSKGYRCPNHVESGIEILEKQCVDCGEIMLLDTRSYTTMRCKKCKLIHKRKLQKKADSKRRDPNYQKQNDELNEEKFKAAMDAWDCIDRDRCLSISLAKTPCAKFLPCYGCYRYISMDVAS